MTSSAPEPQRPDWWRLLRDSALGVSDDFGRLVALQGLWLLPWILGLGLGLVHILGHVLLLAVIPASSALLRAAAGSFRGTAVRLAAARSGATHRWPAAMSIAVLQLLVALIAFVNLQIGLGGATVPMVAAGVLSAWVLLLVAASVVVLWPVLLDPAHDDVPTRQVARTALAVALRRPGRVVLLLVLLVLCVVVIRQTVVAVLVLPAYGAFLLAHGVLPVADDLEGRADPR